MTPEPTVEPTSDAQTNYNTPTPEVTIAPSPSDSFQKEDQLNQTPIPGPSPLADYESLPSATPFAGLANEPVEKVCLSQGEEIKDTVNEDWEINFEEGWAKTKEPVKLGIKYLFPQENKVSVTFKCLPKEGTTQLKIQKVKVSDLKLPEGVNPYGEYAYDITTGMKDGSFEYDMTLPKPEDKSVNVSYMEDKDGEVKQIEEEKINEEGDKVKVEGIDHFTIYFVATYANPELTILTPTATPTPTPYCGDNHKDANEECDGTAGVIPGQNFCTAQCKLVPIYDGAHQCPEGTVKSQNPVVTKLIHSEDPDGETFSLTSGGKYLFEVSGDYSYGQGRLADAAYAVSDTDWPTPIRNDIGVWGANRGVTSLLGDLGNGVGVIEWDNDHNVNTNHIYTKYFSPTNDIEARFLISDWYDGWYSSSNNQGSMGDNSGSLTLNVYECQPVSTVTLCKKDQNQNPLSGWRLYLLGDKVGNTINVPSDGSVVNSGNYPLDNYVLLASGTYNYGDSRMISDAANSYRYVGLPCAGPTDGWVNGEGSSCMKNYLSLNFSTSGGPTAPGWGTYYNPQHKYAKSFSGGNLSLKIWDSCSTSGEGCYGDNEGSLQLDVYKGYVGDTGQNGCVTFENVPYGQYQLGEILQDGWQETSGSGTVTIDNPQKTFTIVNNELPKLGNLEVTKVVDWKNANPDISKNFEICITGPSYPSGNCKNSDYDGQTLSWNNIQIGDYTITETNPGNNWIVTGSPQTVTVNKDQTTKVQIKNEINPIIIKGYKVVCDSEQYLPNWGNHGATIVATTAQDFVNNSQGHCRLEDGWKFQYAKAGSGSFGGFQTNTSELGAPWVAFGPTVSGEATAIISDVSSFGGRIEVREVFKDNTYFPFSNAGNVSAEFYCTGDVYNYDNWEWINNPQYGQTYYCVAFNARKNTEITGKKFNDLNRNGVNDSEPGLGDWKILAAQKVDEINVAAKDMPTVPSNIALESGQKYLLRVSGTFGAGDNITADAKYSVRAPNTFWTDYVQNYGSYGPTLLDLQINNASPNWGSYNPNHVYWLTYTGGGSPINFRIYDIYPPNNSGNLNVKIYKVLSETTTGSDGNYTLTLTGELGENVIVAEETQDGWMQTAPTGYDFGYCNVNAYQTNTCNFGNAVAYGSISGYKYEDINGNGKDDDGGNNRLSDWTIFIDANKNGSLDSGETSIPTDGSGNYKFSSLTPGNYQVCEVLSEGWIATDPTEGNCKNVKVGAGQDVQVNFGNFKLGKVSGYKYGEDRKTGLPGWTIFIDKNDNRILDSEEINVQTDDNGYFEFTGLTAGTYSICEVEQSGWQRMHPSGTNCQDLVITSGSDVKNLNFQNRKVVLGLSLTKSNSAAIALSSGSGVAYTLVIKNTGNQRLTGVTIKDAPSGGFSYVNGSGLLEGNPITPTVLSGYLEWYIGTLEASGDEGDTKTLTYKMKSDSSLPSGVYPNIAIATGVYIPYEHEGNEEVVGIFEPVEVLAVSEDTESGERVESNAGTPVNSQVELKQVLAYSTGVGVVGQVLGAATEAGQVLPAAGSDTRFFVFAIAALIFGLFLKFGSFALNKNWIDYRRLKKGLKNIFASILFLLVFSLFAPFAKAFSDYVSITKLSSYINKEDFKISYSALSENPISAQFYVRKDGDSSWRTLGSALTGASGYVQVSGGDIYNGDGKYFFKVVINGGTAEDETSTIVDRQAPDAVRDYRKEKLGDGHYKLYWRNPDNEDFDKVIIYRSDSTNFTADSSTEVATIWGSKDTEMTSENAAAPGKEYYFAIRAIDKAGNASSVVSDPETQVSAGSVLGASVSATSTPEVVKILPKEKKTGEVLGEEKTEEATPSPTLTPQEEKGGVLGQAVKFAKDRTKLTVGIIAVLLFAGYLGLRKFRSGEKK